MFLFLKPLHECKEPNKTIPGKMVRVYTKKRIKFYDEENIQQALSDVKRGLSIRVAAKENKVPFETLRGRLCKRHANEKIGRPTGLSTEVGLFS